MNEKKFENDTIKQEKAWNFKWSVYARDYELKIPTDENPDNVVTVKKGQIFDGGLTLKNIHHNGYRMAYDIGVIALWVYPKAGAVNNEGKLYKPYKLVLGHKDFEQVNDDYTPLSVDFRAEKKTKNDALTSENDPGSLANFNAYKNSIEHVVTASWKSRKKLFGDDSYHLHITQKYVLTDYNDTPAHEPTGGIFAARMHPMTKIYYENRNDGYLGSVRVDYRMYLSLDTYAYVKGYKDNDITWSRIEGRITSEEKINNHVGLFKDFDDARELAGILGAEHAVFESSEKPLIAEMVGNGIVKGSNIFSIERSTTKGFLGGFSTERTEQYTWDNIHWWGAGGDLHASTPGAFHALHIHWRWAKVLQEKIGTFDILGHLSTPAAGESQFVGESEGGVLTDPKIQNQSIRFAVVRNESLPNGKEYSKHSTEAFEDFFKSLSQTPKEIGIKTDEGADMILYYSSEVFTENQPLQNSYFSSPGTDVRNTANEPLTGNVFLHGIFFAHQDEKEKPTIGGNTSYYTNPDNPDKTKWKRNPKN